MSSQILYKKFREINFTIEPKDIVNECSKLCLLHDLTEEEFVFKYEAFLFNHLAKYPDENYSTASILNLKYLGIFKSVLEKSKPKVYTKSSIDEYVPANHSFISSVGDLKADYTYNSDLPEYELKEISARRAIVSVVSETLHETRHLGINQVQKAMSKWK